MKFETYYQSALVGAGMLIGSTLGYTTQELVHAYSHGTAYIRMLETQNKDLKRRLQDETRERYIAEQHIGALTTQCLDDKIEE